MPSAVVDALFSRARPYPTAAPTTRAGSRAPKTKLNDLNADDLAEILVKTLRLTEEHGTSTDTPSLVHMKMACNDIRTLKLVNADLNQPSALLPTFQRVAAIMNIDPLEIAHRLAETNGTYFNRIKALLAERCAFLSRVKNNPSGDEVREIKRTASNAITFSVIAGRYDFWQTHAERLARAVWFCQHSQHFSVTLHALKALLVSNWYNEELTLSNFPAAKLPPNDELLFTRIVFVELGREIEGVVTEAVSSEPTLTVKFKDAHGVETERKVLRENARVAPTVTRTALEHLLYGKTHVDNFIDSDFSRLIMQASACNLPRVIDALVVKRPHVLLPWILDAVLCDAVKLKSAALIVALAHRDAIAPNFVSTGEEETYVAARDFDKTYKFVRSAEQMELVYFLFESSTPNLFFKEDATAAELQDWQRQQTEEVTKRRADFLQGYIENAPFDWRKFDWRKRDIVTDPKLIEAVANVRAHPLPEATAVALIIHTLKRFNEQSNRDDAQVWVDLARRLYWQVTKTWQRQFVEREFPAAQLASLD